LAQIVQFILFATRDALIFSAPQALRQLFEHPAPLIGCLPGAPAALCPVLRVRHPPLLLITSPVGLTLHAAQFHQPLSAHPVLEGRTEPVSILVIKLPQLLQQIALAEFHLAEAGKLCRRVQFLPPSQCSEHRQPPATLFHL
jgi:hypothetical protein